MKDTDVDKTVGMDLYNIYSVLQLPDRISVYLYDYSR